MRNLHLEKQGIRGLAIAESFSQTSKKSVLSGIVMSTDLVIDGFVLATLLSEEMTLPTLYYPCMKNLTDRMLVFC